MRRIVVFVLVVWTCVLIVWTFAGKSANNLSLPWRPKAQLMREQLKNLEHPPSLSAPVSGPNAQAMELQKQAQDISAFIKSEPPADSLTEAVDLLETTNRQAVLAASQPSLGFVWNGNLAEPGQFPYQVGIVLSNYVPYAKRGYRCGGALVAPTWVLTAGHCFQENSEPADVTVYTGRLKLSESSQPNCNCWSSVKRLVRFPGYQTIPTPYGEILDGDVALLELTSPPSTSGLDSIKMTNTTLEQTLAKTSLGTITGWGKSPENPNSLSDALQYGTVKIAPDAVCTKSYGMGIIKQDMVCATPLPSDACQGDSGGPLVMRLVSGGNAVSYLEGVISWGYPPGGCPSTKPTVYSRVPAFSDWINGCISGGPCASGIPAFK